MNSILNKLNEIKVMVLSTSFNDKVTSRSISVIKYEDAFYFQTSSKSRKYQQLINNSNVSLCINNISINGIASDIGTWNDNLKIKEVFKQFHLGSYNAYGTMESERVIKVKIIEIDIWEYLNNIPKHLTYNLITKEIVENPIFN